MHFTITKWHDENPNDWVALKPGTGQGKILPVVIDRDESLKDLHERMRGKEVVYVKAWMHLIGRDYKIGE